MNSPNQLDPLNQEFQPNQRSRLSNPLNSINAIRNRLCAACKVLGDEMQYVYKCCEIDRRNLEDIPALDKLTSYKKLYFLVEKLKPYLI